MVRNGIQREKSWYIFTCIKNFFFFSQSKDVFLDLFKRILCGVCKIFNENFGK